MDGSTRVSDFSTLFDFLPIGAYRSSPEGQQLRANPALVALNGYASEAEQLAGVRDIATEWYVDPARRSHFAQALDRDGFVRGFVSEVFRHKTRERIWISENAHLVRGAGGRVLYYEGTVEDVSARKQAEDALRESEQRWKLALDSTGDGLWDWNLESGHETFSPAFLARYGYSAEEATQNAELFDQRTHPDDHAAMLRARELHLSGRSPRYENEHRIRCKDGSWRWVLARGVVIQRDPAGRPLRMIGTHTDITERKNAEAMRAERDRAEAADRAKTDLLSRVSHEMRTPLNAVLGFAQLLQSAPDLPEHHQAWVGHLLGSGRHLLSMVDDLLELASVQAGVMTPALEDVDAAIALEAAWSMLAAEASAAGLRIDNPMPAAGHWRVRADTKRLTQVFSNLLSNAVKYNRPNGHIAVAARRDDEAGKVEIDITDGGHGLDASQLARIFQPFNRLGAERSGVNGTGLGLALSRQLLQAMNGDIRVASMPGQGTTFTVVMTGAR
jgi:PAS domain S-box-containing protein